MARLTLLAVVFVLVACTNLCRASLRLTGPYTSTVDDANSEVNCPSGYFVSECSCVDETTCDGTDLFPGNINYCRAGHRYGVNRPTRAIALCKAVSGWSVVIVRGNQFQGQYVSCPHGYTMESCSKRDFWSQYRETYFLKTGTSCAWRKGSGNENRYVRISLVCVKRHSVVVLTPLPAPRPQPSGNHGRLVGGLHGGVPAQK